MNTEEINPHLTAKIVVSYVRHHRLVPDQIADLITSVHRTIGQLGQPLEPEEVLTPAVSVRRSVHRDYVICLDCGHRGKTLRKVREWIAPTLASPDVVLGSKLLVQPHSRVVVERESRNRQSRRLRARGAEGRAG